VGSGGEIGSIVVAPADGVELVEDSDVEDSGVLPRPAETVGDVVVDSAAAVGLGVPLLVDWLGAIPAALCDDERWVVFLVRNDVVDGAVGDSPDACVEGDEPLDVPSDEVLGPWLASEPVLLLDEEEPPELSGPVPSAWAMPDPLARAAPTPRVTAPAPSQPRATRGSGLARCRPFARRERPPAAVFARCPPATSAPRRT
jgi:hypothetical protein